MTMTHTQHLLIRVYWDTISMALELLKHATVHLNGFCLLCRQHLGVPEQALGVSC